MNLDTFFQSLPQLITLGLLIVISGSISASETALFALTRQQLGRFRQSPGRLANAVLRLRQDPDSLLATILLANIAVNILLYSMLAVTASRLGGPSTLRTLILGFLGFVIVLFGAEIVPKLVAFAMCERLAPLVAVPTRALLTVTWPVRRVLDMFLIEPLTRILGGAPLPDAEVRAEELQQLVNICQTRGLIDERENALLHRVMELADLRVSELMVPRVDVVAFDLARDKAELAELIAKARLLRIPAYEGDIDNVKGVILARDFFLNRHHPLKELVRPARFIPEQARVESLLEQFRLTESKSALVVDEYGGLAGVVALEDIVEAIVGELHAPDEPDVMPGLQRIDETTFWVDAGLDVDDFCRAFNLPTDESRIHTVGGLIAAELDRLPRQGDEVTLGHVCLTVVAMKGRRVVRASLALHEPPEQNPDLVRLLDAQQPPRGELPSAPGSNPA